MASNPVSLSELEKALDDLIMRDAPPYLTDAELSVSKLMKRAKVTEGKAREMLEQWTENGEAEYIGKRREPRGHAVDAWRLVVKGV